MNGSQPPTSPTDPAATADPTGEPSPDDIRLFKALTSRVGDADPGRLKLPPDEEQTLSAYVIRDFEDADSANNPYKTRMAEMVANWRGTTEEKDFPFAGASNVQVPFTSVVIEQMIARLMKAIFGSDLWQKINLVDQQVTTQALDEANQWFQWELREIVKIKRVMHDILHDILVVGIQTPIATYRDIKRDLHSTRLFAYDPNASPSKLIEDGCREIIEQKSPWGVPEPMQIGDQTRPGVFSLLAPDQTGKMVDAGKVIWSLDLEKGQLKADIWKRETIFNGVKINLVNIEDLVVANSAQCIDDLPFFGVRMFLPVIGANSYREGLDDGYFIDYGQEENERIAATADIKWGTEIDQPVTDLQDNEEGTDSRDSYAYTQARKFIEIYRWEGWWVWDKSKGGPENIEQTLAPMTQVCVWVSVRAQKVIKIERVEDLNKDGKRSAVKFGFMEEPGRFYPMGLAEWVRHSQAILNAVSNQRLDAGIITMVPYGFYKPTVGLKGILNLRPGTLYPTPDPQGVNFPRSGWTPNWGFQEEMLQKQYGGEQAGLTDGAMGRPTSKRQSATEIQALAAALDLRTELVVENLLESIRELLYRVLGQYQQFGPRERMFRVGGVEGMKVTKQFEMDRLSGKILLEMTGNLAQINQQMTQQLSIEMFQLLMNEILVQMGIVKPDTVYAAIQLIAKAHNYDTVPLHRPDVPAMSDPPNVEEQQMFAGQKPIGPTLDENIPEHLQHHALVASDARLMANWTPQARLMLQQHIQATLQMQQAQQLMRQQQAAMAVQAAQSGQERGIRPGKPGGQRAGQNTGPGTKAEGVQPPPQPGPTNAQPAPAQQ